MTFFLSGIYLAAGVQEAHWVPAAEQRPRRLPDIGYLTDDHVKSTIGYIRKAWLGGHEIGTHFNGHFCGGQGSVANWTPKQWTSEIEQAKSFL